MIGGLAAMSLAPTIAMLIAGLLIVVVLSYRQTVHAYPQGGGAYRVSKENLGETGGPLGGGRAADRLHADRGGVGRGRRRRDHVRVSRTCTSAA